MTEAKKLHLLLLEDSENDAALLIRDLKKGGYEIVVERADSREKMEAAMEKHPWDIVISDYNMPNFNALEALTLLKKSGKDLPFLVVSGTIGEETAVETMKAGAHDYVMKGNLSRLIPAVEREIREAKIRAQRVHAELALYESEEKFRFMFEHNPIPMWVANGETQTFFEVNDAAVTRYGYSRREFLQMKVTDLLAPASPSLLEKQIGTKNSPPLGHRLIGEEKHRLKNGDIIEVEIHSDTLELGNQKLVLIIAQDITHRKQTERDLIQARETALETSRLKSEFLANVSHEIRTPLNGIIGMTELLLRESLRPKEKEYVDTIRISGDSLLNIVNQVLDFSKSDAGKLEFEKIHFALSDTMKESVEWFSYAAKNKNLNLELHIDPDLPSHFNGDPVRLRQILINLMDNAIKFTKQGQIVIRVEKVSEQKQNVTLRFVVQDTGIGIQERSRDRLFLPFSQADSSLTRKYGGTGLGLAICEKLVSLMGGKIGFESEWGKGSLFWFTLNLEKVAGEEDKPSKALQNGQVNLKSTSHIKTLREHSKRILVVEDSLVNKKVIMEMVKKIGFKVTGVVNGKEAVKEVRSKSYDAVLMDCQMPVMDGYQATAEIREIEKNAGRRTPIIAVTAHAMKGDREKCLRAGMDDYLSKPLDSKMLESIIKKWIPA